MAHTGVLLVLEVSTARGSVALVDEGAACEVIAQADVTMGAARDDGLFPAVESLLRAAGLHAGELSGIVCGAGPGSFTSLRIGASLAKGLAHGARVPVRAVSSLLLAAAAHDEPGEYVVHSDALRQERFGLGVCIERRGVRAVDGTPVRLPLADLAAFAAGRRRLAVLASPDEANEHAVVAPHASLLARVAGWDGTPVPLDRWEPDYGRLAEAQVVWERTHGHALPGA